MNSTAGRKGEAVNHVSGHKLMYDYRGETPTARCVCGRWAWDESGSKDLLPLLAFNAIESAYRRHVEEAEADDIPSVVCGDDARPR